MQVSANVIKDLLPLYQEGALSEDSRQLVQRALEEDASLREFAALLQGITANNRPDYRATDDALATLAKTQRLLARQRWLQGFAIFCSLAPLSFVVQEGDLRFLLLRDSPLSAALLWALATALWAAYWRSRRAVMR